MSLERGTVKGFEHDRMVMLFSMMDGDKEICCAVSSSAMDDLERGVKAKPDQRTISSCACVTASSSAHRANSLPRNLRDARRGSSCAAWIFAARGLFGGQPSVPEMSVIDGQSGSDPDRRRLPVLTQPVIRRSILP